MEDVMSIPVITTRFFIIFLYPRMCRYLSYTVLHEGGVHAVQCCSTPNIKGGVENLSSQIRQYANNRVH